MKNQNDFLAKLNEVKSLALMQNNSITSNDIKNNFKDMELSDSDFDSIYAYLAENKISVVDILGQVSWNEGETKEGASAHLEFYMEDVNNMDELTAEELAMQFVLLRDNDKAAYDKLVYHFLRTVVEIANEYKEHGAFLDDLIQEGNIGLMMALNTLDEVRNMDDYVPYIKENIKMSILNFIDENNEKSTLENAILAKSNLVSEAAKQLEEDLGHPATIDELADYTKIPYNEIKDILDLAGNTK